MTADGVGVEKDLMELVNESNSKFQQRARQLMIDDVTWEMARREAAKRGLRSTSEFIRIAIRREANEAVEDKRGRIIQKRFVRSIWILDLMTALIGNGAVTELRISYRNQLAAQYREYYQAKDGIMLLAQLMKYTHIDAIVDEMPVERTVVDGRKRVERDFFIFTFPAPVKAKDMVEYKRRVVELVSRGDVAEVMVLTEKEKKRVLPDDSLELKKELDEVEKEMKVKVKESGVDVSARQEEGE